MRLSLESVMFQLYLDRKASALSFIKTAEVTTRDPLRSRMLSIASSVWYWTPADFQVAPGDLTTISSDHHHAKTALDTERMPGMPQEKDKGVSKRSAIEQSHFILRQRRLPIQRPLPLLTILLSCP